jgi:hypothetical protein
MSQYRIRLGSIRIRSNPDAGVVGDPLKCRGRSQAWPWKLTIIDIRDFELRFGPTLSTHRRTVSFLRLLVHVVDHDYGNRPFLLHQLQSELFFHCFKDCDAIGDGSFVGGI